MDETDPFRNFDRAAVAAGAVIDRIRPEQWDDPTPCSEWTVRQVLDHLVGGNVRFAAMMAGGEVPPPGPQAVDFPDSVAALRGLLAEPDGLSRVVATPFGAQPGGVLLHMRTTEMMVHGWDLARATGQSTDLDPEVAEFCLAAFRRMRDGNQRTDTMFGPVREIAGDASAADRLAAYSGRAVG